MKPARIFLLCLLAWTTMSVQAAAGTLADKPLILQQPVKPNIILAVDDSGSMDSEVLLPTNDGAAWWHTGRQSFSGLDQNDVVVGGNTVNFNRAGNADATWKKYVYLFPNGQGSVGTGLRIYTDSTNDHFAIPPLPRFAWARSPRYNTAYFNPAITYEPWVSTSTWNFTNASPTAAPSDPVFGTFTFNLTANIESSSSNRTFKMHSGMVIPAGTYRKIGSNSWGTSSTDQTLTSTVDVGIRYFPAVFYLNQSDDLPAGYGFTGTTITGYAPDGVTPLVGYEIKPGNFVSTAAYDAAIQNFANWFTYHRKRHAATRGAIGKSFNPLSNMRVGAFRINNRVNVTMRDLSVASDKNAFINDIYQFVGSGGTPNKESVRHMGEQFRRTGSGAPITAQCQQNFGILFTDGYSNLWTGAGVGNADGDKGSPFADTVSDTMADIAMHYYSTNLRPDLEAGQVPVPSQCLSGTPHPSIDCNKNLHMVTFAVTLGTRGHIYGVDMSATNDPYANPPAWPTTFLARNPSAVDDLWHATINARGELLNTNSPDEISEKLTGVLNTIATRASSMAAVTTNTTRLSEGTAIYQARFSSIDWSGQFLAFEFNGTLQAQVWDAAQRIPNTRNIYTIDPAATTSPGRSFTWADLTTGQQAELNKNAEGAADGRGQDRLAYLRGDRSKEQSHSGGIFRNRNVLLGDIVNSDPLFIGTPNYGFHVLPGVEGSSYLTFRNNTSYKTRTPMIYIGANDGMLHAFDASLGTSGGGEEKFAYVPHTLFPKLSQLTSPSYDHTYFVDGSPRAVDAYVGGVWRTMLVGALGAGGKAVFALDVTEPDNFNETHVRWEISDSTTGFGDLGHIMGQPTIVRLTSGNWAAVFGNGYHNANHKAVLYVVDIATGTLLRAIDTGVVGTVANPNGLSSPRPMDTNGDRITDFVYAGDLHGNMWKFDLRSTISSEWDVAFIEGTSRLPLFTARDDGGNTQPITTRPIFFSHPNGGYMVLFGTGKFFENEDTDITSPQVQTFYGVRDHGTRIANSRDDLLEQWIFFEGSFVSEGGQVIPNTRLRVLTDHRIEDWDVHKGWYLDLVSPDAGEQGERSISDAILVRTRKGDTAVVFNTMIPSSDPCDFGGSGWLMEFDALNGGRFSYSLLDVNGDGKVDEADYTTVRIGDQDVRFPVSGLAPKADGFGDTPVVISAGELSYKVYSLTSGAIEVVTELGTGETLGRQSWRQLR
jgi:type IV pilus assembly protein PilY1